MTKESTTDDKIFVNILKLRPYTEEELKYVGTGIWPIKKITLAEAKEMFPCPKKQ